MSVINISDFMKFSNQKRLLDENHSGDYIYKQKEYSSSENSRFDDTVCDEDTDYKELYYQLYNDLHEIIVYAKNSGDIETVFSYLMNALLVAEDRFLDQPEN